MNLRKSPRCLAAAFDLPVHLELGILIAALLTVLYFPVFPIFSEK